MKRDKRNTLLHAAKLLEREARIIKASNVTSRGNWHCSDGVREEYRDLVRTARRLRKASAVLIDGQERHA